MQFYIITLWAHSIRWCNDIYHTFVHSLTVLNRFKFIKAIVRYDIEHQRQKKKKRQRWVIKTLSGRRNCNSSRIKCYSRKSNLIWDERWQWENFNHEFSENDAVDYIALVEKKRARNKNLKIKREYQILLKRNKRLQTFF